LSSNATGKIDVGKVVLPKPTNDLHMRLNQKFSLLVVEYANKI
jgi:hypothetical protein